MRSTAISVLLLAASATLVTAAPAKDETAERVSYTEPSDDPAEGPWVELASPTPARHGREFITVDAGRGPLAMLRIDAHQGRPVVKSVTIHFADGATRVVKVGARLGAKKRSHAVDLGDPKAVDHIIVVTDARSKGSYSVYGAPAGSVAQR